MQRYCFLVFLVLFIQKGFTTSLLGEHQNPSPALLEIFQVLNIPHDSTAQSLNAIAQKEFLRKPDQERWEMPKKYEDKRVQLFPIFKKLGVLDAVLPSKKKYDYILIYGATVKGMQRRLAFLNQLWLQGVRAEKIVFLTGERPLDPTIESAGAIFDPVPSEIVARPGWERPHKMPLTEAEAARILWDQIILADDLRTKEIFFISVPMIKDPETGKLIRPQTKHTIEAWLKTSPKAGICLAISSNPYVPYQHHTLLNILIKKGYVQKFPLETVGPAAGRDTSIAIHLDNIARWLYTEMQFF
jgi:hypothetical protein